MIARTDARLPLYHRLRDTFAEAIASGTWRIGDAIPTEAELARTHGVALGTVRKAIDHLVDDGLIYRVQGRGTFVRRPTFSSSLARFFFAHDGRRITDREESRIMSVRRETPPPDAAAGLKLDGAPADAIHILRLRLTSGEPLLFEQIWLPLEPFAPLLHDEPSTFPVLLYPMYESRFDVVVARAEETLSIAVAPPIAQEHLRLGAGEAVAVLERRAFSQTGEVVEWRRSIGDGKRFRYAIDLR